MKKRVNIRYGALSHSIATKFIEEIQAKDVIVRIKDYDKYFELIVSGTGGFVFTTTDSRTGEYNKKDSGGLKQWFDGSDRYEDFIKHLRCSETKKAALSKDELYHLLITGNYYIG